VTIRVVIADDQELVRSGFRMILEARDDIEVVAEARTGDEAVTMTRLHHPDVVLMDIRMPGLDGIEATRRIVDAGLASRVIVLTTYDADEFVFAALRAGATGFLLKDVRPSSLVDAVRTAAAGNSLLDPAITQKVIQQFTSTTTPPKPNEAALTKLTDREREVLLLIARGHNNAEIASVLYVSEATVKTHVSSLLRKLGLRDRVQAVVFAFENGVAPHKPPE
jgi:DNA-binding NarL/FixJ family response regulator